MFLESDGRPVKCATLLSGGMDSAVLLYHQHPMPQVAVTVDYMQMNYREVGSAAGLCEQLGIEHVIVSVDGVHGGSLLGEGGEMSGPDTVVPNRNAILLHLAANVAVTTGCCRMAIGCNKTDHELYHDCRPEYLQCVGRSLAMLHGLRLFWPFGQMTKSDIRELGDTLDVPFDKTWSCYRNGSKPCGTCGACEEVMKSSQGKVMQ